MSAKERFILAASISSVMVAMVTLVAELLNLGLRHDFVEQWVKAYFIAWPVAALTGFAVMPMARRLTSPRVGTSNFRHDIADHLSESILGFRTRRII